MVDREDGESVPGRQLQGQRGRLENLRYTQGTMKGQTGYRGECMWEWRRKVCMVGGGLGRCHSKSFELLGAAEL